MSSRALGTLYLVLGVLLMLVAFTADRLGLGAAPGLGWKQITGAALGVAVAAFGMVKLRGN